MKAVAFLTASEGVEQVELTEPWAAVERAGFRPVLIADTEDGQVQAYHHLDKADRFEVDLPPDKADPGDYAALILPGGVANGDKLRAQPAAVALAQRIADADTPIAVICHGGWVLIEAGVVNGRRLTSWPSMQTDYRNAGATWLNRPLVVDEGHPMIISSRKPADLPAFCDAVVKSLDQDWLDQDRLDQGWLDHTSRPNEVGCKRGRTRAGWGIVERTRPEVRELVNASIEVERKFDIPEEFDLPPLAGAGDASEFDLDATYYDTADFRLLGHRMTLRRRLGGHDGGWHLKRPAGGERSEAQYPDAEKMPRELTDQVRAVIRDEPLVPIVRILNHRQEIPVERDHGRVLLAVDQVRAERNDGDVREWRELEIELVDGATRALDEIAATLVEAGARPSESPSKLSRALGDRPAETSAEDLTKAEAALAGYLRAQRDELIANDPLVRVGDADGVHDMRVAVRRIRSTLGTFGKDSSTAIRDELKWLSDLIGAVRDRDVLAEALIADIKRTQPDLVPGRVARRIRKRLRSDTASARTALGRALNSSRYFRILDTLDEIADVPADVGPAYLKKRTRKRLRTADSELAAALPTADPAALHEARKSYKKARYAVELSGGKRGRKLTTRLKDLQDLLGAHQDAIVACRLLKELGDEAAANGEPEFGFGVLYAHQLQLAADRRAEVPRALRRARKPKIRRWLE